MKKIISFIFLIVCQNLFCQDKTLDSLERLAARTPADSTRLKIYQELCDICPADQNLKYGNLTVALAEKLIAASKTDKEKTKYIREKLRGMSCIEIYYLEIRDFEKLESLSLKDIELAKSTHDTDLVHDEINDLVENYLRANKITPAMNYLMKILEVAEKKGDKKETIFALSRIAKVYSRIRNPQKSLDYQFKVLKLNEELGLHDEIPWVYFNIGMRYADLKKHKEAIEYYLKSNQLLKNRIEKDEDVRQMFFVAISSNELGEYSKAREYYQKALKSAEEIGDPVIQGVVWSELGEMYFREKNYASALEHKLKGLALIGDKSEGDAFRPNLTTGDVYLAMGKYDEAEKYVLKARSIAENRLDLYNQKAIEEVLYKIYEGKHQPVKANEHRLAFYILKDSIAKNENNEELIYKEMNYENERNEMKRLAEQNIKDGIAEADKKRQQIIIGAVSLVLLLVLAMLVFIYRNYRLKQRSNEELSLKNEQIAAQKHLVEEKQKEILDSISYAKRLQDAILPPREFVNAQVKNFILYRPKDIVAGDFYWAEKIDELFFIAAADSTGHGVPGAMVSVVCSNALNRAVKEFHVTETGKVLDKTRELVLQTFEKSASEVKDGMDISLLCIDRKNKRIHWSGANNPLWYVHNGVLEEIKADKQPIGRSDHAKPFTTHTIAWEENTTFYLFTDGLADQFGGPNGKKFKYKQFSGLLEKCQELSEEEQSVAIDKAFNDWKGNLEQVDDVCVIGLRI